MQIARIDELTRFEALERFAIDTKVFGLASGHAGPGQAEPGQIVLDRHRIGFPAALAVDILEPQQQGSTRLSGQVAVEERRVSVAEMQVAVGRRGEAEHGHVGGGVEILSQARYGAVLSVKMARRAARVMEKRRNP